MRTAKIAITIDRDLLTRLDRLVRDRQFPSRAEGIRETILRQGRQKFGEVPSQKQQKALEALSDIGRMEALAGPLLVVDSWSDLLGEGQGAPVGMLDRLLTLLLPAWSVDETLFAASGLTLCAPVNVGRPYLT